MLQVQSRHLTLCGDQKYLVHAHYVFRETDLLNKILLTYLALETFGKTLLKS
jgi:hypothetical protein